MDREETEQREFAPGPRAPGVLFLHISENNAGIQAPYQEIELQNQPW